MNKRQQRFYDTWLHTNYRLSRDEWEYIALLCLAFAWALPTGFLIGQLILLGL